MYDKLKIAKIIGDIEADFRRLADFGLTEKSGDKEVYASSMAMISILTRTFDLVEDIIIKNEWGIPNRYRDYFKIIAERGVIDDELRVSLENLADWRNIFAHEYFNMDKKKVIKIKGDIFYVRELIEKVKKYISKEGKNEE